MNAPVTRKARSAFTLLTQPLTLLRLEGLALLTGLVTAYFALRGPWWGLPLGLLADLSMLGYVCGPRIGAALYNLLHATALPVLLGLLGFTLHFPGALLVALVWLSHVGLDRAAGYGLKFPDGFEHTHLNGPRA